MEKYLFERSMGSCEMIFNHMVKSDNEYYNNKAREWIKRHNVGRIRKTEVVNNKLIIISHGLKGDKLAKNNNRGELNEINLDDGSVSTVFGYIPMLLGKYE